MPTVIECAWHPKYHGKRLLWIKGRLPSRISDADLAEFVVEAERRNLISHGACKTCLPILRAEAMAGRRRNRRGIKR